MKKLIKKSSIGIITLLAVFAFQTFCMPSTAVARWHDRSDELPGMDNNITPILIGGAVLIGGILIYKLSKKGSEDDFGTDIDTSGTKTDDTKSETEESSDSLNTQSSSINISSSQNKKHVGLYFDIDHEQRDRIKNAAFDVSDITFKVGLKLGF